PPPVFLLIWIAPRAPAAAALLLTPAQSTVQPTPYRLVQLACGLEPDSAPQFQVPPTWTSTVPELTCQLPSAFWVTFPLMTLAVPLASGRGLAAFANAAAAVPTSTAMTANNAVQIL